MPGFSLKVVVLVSGWVLTTLLAHLLLIVAHREVDESSFLLLDTLKTRDSATYLCQDESQIADLRQHTQQGQVHVVERYVEQRRSDRSVQLCPLSGYG